MELAYTPPGWNVFTDAGGTIFWQIFVERQLSAIANDVECVTSFYT